MTASMVIVLPESLRTGEAQKKEVNFDERDASKRRGDELTTPNPRSLSTNSNGNPLLFIDASSFESDRGTTDGIGSPAEFVASCEATTSTPTSSPAAVDQSPTPPYPPSM